MTALKRHHGVVAAIAVAAAAAAAAHTRPIIFDRTGDRKLHRRDFYAENYANINHRRNVSWLRFRGYRF